MLVLKIPPANEGDIRDVGSILGEGHGSPLQYSCLENPMDRGAWRAVVHGVTKSWTRLKRLSTWEFLKFREILVLSFKSFGKSA